MSDDDFMLESDGEEDTGVFDYTSGEEDDDSGNVDVENSYYNAKGMKQTDPQAAIDEFLGVAALEAEKGEWYKCLEDGGWSLRTRPRLIACLAI